MKKLIALALALVLVLGLLSGCASSGSKTIKIGVFEPQSGDNGAGGKQETLGIQYANSVKPTVTVGGTEYIYLHSNRDTFFEIYRVGVDGSNLERITNTSNSEGFPVMNPDGTRLLFTRDRELWSSAPTGGTEKRVTRRY